MSDFYHAIVDVEATPDEAEALAREVVRRLVAEGIVEAQPDPEAALGPPAYRPGSRITELCRLSPPSWHFVDLVTNGLEVCTERWVNIFAFTVSDVAFGCPNCGAAYSLDDSVGKRFTEAIAEFYHGNDQPQVKCPACSQESPAPSWHTNPHLGFAHLAFVFWNWEPFDSSSWKVDISRLIGETLHHKVVVTYGRV